MTDTLKILLLGSVVLSPTAVFAEETADVEAEAPDEIVVTASRREQNINDVGASISVIGAEALERGQYSFVIDALQTLPGVTINQNGAIGGLATVSIRGAATAQTVILIDGVQMNDVSSPAGGFNFGSLDPTGIERIEVLKGPQAVLYGSDAIGGVVNIITKTGGEGLTGSAFVEYGAFETFRGGITLAGGTEDLGFNFSASDIQSDGISKADAADGNTEADAYESYTLRGRVTAKLSDNVRLEAFGNYTDSKAEIDGFSFNPVTFSFDLGDTADRSLSEDYLIGGRLHAKLLNGKFNNTVSVEYSGIDRLSISAFGETPGTGRRFNLDYLGVFNVDENWSLSGGAQRESVKAASASVDSFAINSAFGMVAYDSKTLSFSAGLRVDDHDTFGTKSNAQARVSYNFEATNSRIFANWGEGFKAPSIFQLTFDCSAFCAAPQSLPRVDLRPEVSNALEFGFSQGLPDDSGTIRVTYFDQKITDLIDFGFVEGYSNISSARLEGVEINLDLALSDAVNLVGNYTYTSAINRDTDERLIRRPKNQFYAALDYQVTENFSTNVGVTIKGAQLDSGNRTVDNWTRIDLRAAYKINDHIELYGRIDNLFDVQYQQISGYGTPGISSFFGVRGNF